MATTDYVYNVPAGDGTYYSGPVSGAPAGSVGSISLSSTANIQDASGNWIPSETINYPTSYFSGGEALRSSTYDASAPISSSSLSYQAPINIGASGGATTIGGSGAGITGGTRSAVTSALTPPNASYDAKTGQWTYTAQDTQVQEQNDLQKMMESLVVPEQESVFQSQQYQQAEQQRQQAVQEQNRISGQITSIVNQAQAAALATTGQGRGIEERILGGQQAQIYKEAAIQALPLKAQLAIAQGNVQLATDHLKDISNLLSEQVQIKYQKQVKVYDAVRGFLDKRETARLNALENQAKYAHDDAQNNLKMMDNLGQKLAANGQASLIPSVMRLDPTDPNFRDNYGRIAGQITPKGGGTGNTTKTFTYGGKVYSYQVDSTGNPLTAPQEVTDASTEIGGNVTKGNLSDANFVERALNDKGVSYQDALDKIPEGKVGVIQNSTGEIGAIDPEEYDPKLYTYL